jgi:NTP pyrophosphatase (non-canonical NTP hydrolase)
MSPFTRLHPSPCHDTVEGTSFSTESPRWMPETAWTLNQVQRHIRTLYGAKDASRGIEGTFMWFMEEVGELSASLRGDKRHPLPEEFADVLAWLATLANVAGIDLNQALADKYGKACPGCGAAPCACVGEKP